MSEVAATLDVDEVLAEMGAHGREVRTSDFIKALIVRFGYTFEYARNVVYSLIEGGRAVLTDSFTLRLA